MYIYDSTTPCYSAGHSNVFRELACFRTLHVRSCVTEYESTSSSNMVAELITPTHTLDDCNLSLLCSIGSFSLLTSYLLFDNC